ncbi:cytidylate kinase [Chryseomicrobium aureum]|uniref:(d)CMP kinase n=1 Tax=Chryseomicrobium aureum TaxID=1441723 RepID=UPI00195E71D1|nr:(d)CMP kinase [Chryseomicrobium aureum]MBM7705503.1 cytidylate kinase [Chryseomicrobium aureum]
MKTIRIAIDGPAGAGKSTIAKLAAEKLNYTYVDTGAMYRAITYKSIKNGLDLSSEQEIVKLLEETSIELQPSENGQQLYLDGENVSEAIRTQDVTANVSQVAAHALVREDLVKRQMVLANTGGVIMDGRDIGTHVIPDAELKIFMSASADERARRRFVDNEKRGIHIEFEELKADIIRRDKFDSEREASPLVQAEDALYLDTTELSIEQVVDEIYMLAKAKESEQ